MPTSNDACLVLRLAGPLQSWGTASQYSWRETANEPTKSAIVGLLAAADGRHRDADISDLVNLRMGVRIDQPGQLLRDFHTAADYRGLPMPSARVNKQGRQEPRTGKDRFAPQVTYRFYLQDAVFTVALAGKRPNIERLAHAVRRPAFPLALGRRSCPPSRPIFLDLTSATDPDDIDTVLKEVPWQATKHHRNTARGATVTLAITVDDPTGTETRGDVPVTFNLKAPGQRSSRRVRRGWVTVPTGNKADPTAPATSSHDPFALLGW